MAFDLAQTILANARGVCHLDVEIVNVTPGDGNCFYWGVLDQIRRPDLVYWPSA